MKTPYNITIPHLWTTALCTTPFLMIACFTLGNSINGCSISTCHHTMSKFQCSLFNLSLSIFSNTKKCFTLGISINGSMGTCHHSLSNCQISTRLETTWIIFMFDSNCLMFIQNQWLFYHNLLTYIVKLMPWSLKMFRISGPFVTVSNPKY